LQVAEYDGSIFIYLKSSKFALRDYFYYTEKKKFNEGSKILLDTDLKIILLDHQNNFIGTLKLMLQKILIF